MRPDKIPIGPSFRDPFLTLPEGPEVQTSERKPTVNSVIQRIQEWLKRGDQ